MAGPSGTRLTEALFFDDDSTQVEITNSTLGVQTQENQAIRKF